MKKREISVIGGGISGITTALCLLEHGFQTTVYADQRFDNSELKPASPAFASLYPAACIIPHTVEMSDLSGTFRHSQDIFAELAAIPQSGIRWQEHYELSACDEVTLPPYARVLEKCEIFGSSPDHLPFSDAVGKAVTGWVAQVLFAEMPVYSSYLVDRFLSGGGTLVQKHIDTEGIADLPSDIVINCSGLYAQHLVGDTGLYPISGHLLFVEGAPFPSAIGKKVFSYNYTPVESEYQYDVYFFPRAQSRRGPGGWLLGGSRAIGSMGDGGTWIFPQLKCPLKHDVPEPVFEINRRILLHLTGVDINRFSFSRKFGYRPARKQGVCLESTELAEKTVIHNYGHGGGGVALSWGCAYRVHEIVSGMFSDR